MIEYFKEYELAMTGIHQYYDLPLVSYSYTDDMLLLQSPIYVKHYKQQTMGLFSYKYTQHHIIQTESFQMKNMSIPG